MHPRHISIADFTYHLPDHRIARYPLEHRDASKLLVYNQGHISHTSFSALPQQLPAGAMLVFNNSKVIEARLLFEKSSGGIIEIFALEPHEQYADITTAMNATGSILYKCLVGGANKWKPGVVLHKQTMAQGEPWRVEARLQERRPDCFIVELQWWPQQMPFASVLHLLGQMPIPPYLQRQADDTDTHRYQTVYAREHGSVAAPTAGLHFTPAVLQALPAAGISQAFVTLHVGAGTFKPVKSTTMEGHEMHAEFLDVDEPFLQQLCHHQRVIPVGTTSMRTLESLYWMGVKAWLNPNINLTELQIGQWEVYDTLAKHDLAPELAIESLLRWMQQERRNRLIVKTQIMIAPGYHFKICKGLVTNFHQPNSTLLLLVAALIGPQWQQVYTYALENDFRFLSYGDSSLLLPAAF